jgi:tetraacyldisaccharide 4'-kinase
MTARLKSAAASMFAAAWEARRRAYAAGWRTPYRVDARVVSIGNLAVGGTGKTTLTLSLARAAHAARLDVAVVCRRYRPGPAGRGDEELLMAAALGEERVYAGGSKWRLARRAAAMGRRLVLVDDGFSHWRLERDLDIVLLDAEDPWAGGLLPAGRSREPRRALQRADVVVVSHARDTEHAAAALRALSPWAPAARGAAGRHRIAGVRDLEGRPRAAAGPARVVTATGNPRAVVRSAATAGFSPVHDSPYRDHHWFTGTEARRELAAARAAGATLLLTAKDAVRWPIADARVAVLEVEWEWLLGGAEVVTEVLAVGARA